MLGIIFIIAIFIFIAVFGLKSNSKSKKTPTAEHFSLLDENGNPVSDPRKAYQPEHFELLDRNGDPIKEPEVKHLEYFCIKDKGYHVSVWPKEQGIGECLQFVIAGINHVDDIDNYLGEFVGTLVADPSNPYDPNAIKILTNDGHRVGYVPKDQTKRVRDFTTIPCSCYCYIGNNNGYHYSCCYVTIK